jgi:hypothetical protein
LLLTAAALAGVALIAAATLAGAWLGFRSLRLPRLSLACAAMLLLVVVIADLLPAAAAPVLTCLVAGFCSGPHWLPGSYGQPGSTPHEARSKPFMNVELVKGLSGTRSGIVR